MPVTIGDVVTEAQELLGEVAGPGVQAFSEDRMIRDALRAFRMVFTKYGWEQYLKWYRYELDGSTGLITNPNGLNAVQDYSDFMAVHKDGDPNPLSVVPPRFNPYTLTAATSPRYWTSLDVLHGSYEGKKLQFYPLTAQGFVNIQARVRPAVMDETTVVYIDKDLLVYATAFMGLALDDLNAQGTETCKQLMQTRYEDILASLSGHPISTGTGAAPLSDWTQIP